jgi:two-component system, cell cycle response regulator DivK
MVARILIVEDDDASRELVSFLLEKAGYEVWTEPDGAAGLAAALARAPDLIISDLQMPRLNGYELARRLAAESRWRRVPLIAVSAFSMRGDREKALAAGFDEYIAKPIAPETFVRDVAAYLPEPLRAPDLPPEA